MFRTEHFEGRLRYETNKVVCIDMHINANYDPNCTFVTQVLISLVNNKSIFYPASMNNSLFSLTVDEFSKEVNLGISTYLKHRQKLGLD